MEKEEESTHVEPPLVPSFSRGITVAAVKSSGKTTWLVESARRSTLINPLHENWSDAGVEKPHNRQRQGEWRGNEDEEDDGKKKLMEYRRERRRWVEVEWKGMKIQRRKEKN